MSPSAVSTAEYCLSLGLRKACELCFFSSLKDNYWTFSAWLKMMYTKGCGFGWVAKIFTGFFAYKGCMHRFLCYCCVFKRSVPVTLPQKRHSLASCTIFLRLWHVWFHRTVPRWHTEGQYFCLLLAMDLLELGDDVAAGAALFWEWSYVWCAVLFSSYSV